MNVSIKVGAPVSISDPTFNTWFFSHRDQPHTPSRTPIVSDFYELQMKIHGQKKQDINDQHRPLWEDLYN